MVYHKKPFSDSYFFPCLCCINLLKIQLGRKTENLHKMFSNKNKSVLYCFIIKGHLKLRQTSHIIRIGHLIHTCWQVPPSFYNYLTISALFHFANFRLDFFKIFFLHILYHLNKKFVCSQILLFISNAGFMTVQ